MSLLLLSENNSRDKCCLAFLRICYSEEVYTSILNRCSSTRQVQRQQLQRNLLMFINILLLQMKFSTEPLSLTIVPGSKHLQLLRQLDRHELYSFEECLQNWSVFENTEFGLNLTKTSTSLQISLNNFLRKHQKTAFILRIPYEYPLERIENISLLHINQTFWKVFLQYSTLFRTDVNQLSDYHSELIKMLRGKQSSSSSTLAAELSSSRQYDSPANVPMDDSSDEENNF